MAKYLAPKRALATHVEMLALADGDELQLNHLPAPQAPYRALVLHGLEGNIHSHYVRGMMQALQQQGFDVTLMHFRGCHGQPNLKARAYHSGDTADLAAVIEHLQRKPDSRPLVAVGFSLGGNVLAKYCAEQGAANPLHAAAVVCAPLQLSACADRINQGFSKVYQRYLLNRLKRTMQRKLAHHSDFPVAISLKQIQAIRSIREFDDCLTAPLHGFVDAADYYQRASAGPLLGQVRCPMLLVHAEDDPFLAEVLPTQSSLPACIKLLRSRHGGHVGFVSGGLPWRPTYYLDQTVPQFFRFHLESRC